MKKLWHLLLLTAAALPLYAGPALRIDLVGHSPGTTLDTISAPEGAVFEHPAWDTKENSRRRRLWMYLPEVKDNQWRKFEIRFRTDRKQLVRIGFSRMRQAAGEQYPYLQLRNLKTENFPLKPEWTRSLPELKPVATEQGSLLIPAGETLYQDRVVNGAVELVISGEYRFTDRSSVRPEEPSVAFESGRWKLILNRGNGSWRSLAFDNRILFTGETPPFELKLDGGKSLNSEETRLVKSRFDAKSGTLELEYAAPEWNFIETIQFGATAPNRLRRQVSFAYLGNDPDRSFHRFTWLLTMPCRGKYLFPGVFFNNPMGIWDSSHKFSGAGSGQWGRGRLEHLPDNAGLYAPHYVGALLLEQEKGPSLLFVQKKEQEGCAWIIRRRGGTLRIELPMGCAGWAKQGVRHELDPLYLEASPRPIRQALRDDLPKLFTATGQTAPQDRPARVAESRIYGSYGAEFQMANFNDAAGGEAERVREMGFNVFYLPPVQVSTVRYNPVDFTRVDPTWGNWEEYRNFAAKLKDSGIALMQDIVPHGGEVPSILERLFLYNGMTLSGRPADFNSPEWNRKLRQYARNYCEHGAEAFRIDAVAGSSCPNWRRAGRGLPRRVPFEERFKTSPRNTPLPNGVWERFLAENGGQVPALSYPRASLAELAGGIRVMNTIRGEAKRVSSENFTLAETHGYPYTRFADLSYDILTNYLPYKINEIPAEPFAAQLAQYLEESRYADVPGALMMRSIVTNDNRHALAVCGFSASRPLEALLYFCEGVPLCYSDHMFGNYRFYQKLNELRRTTPELSRGTPRYTHDGGALLIERRGESSAVLAVLNFAPETRTIAPVLPEALQKAPSIVDAMSGRAIARRGNRAELSLAPWDILLLKAGVPEKEATAAAPRAVAKNTVRQNGNRIEAGSYTLRFDPATALPEAILSADGRELFGAADLLSAAWAPLPEKIETGIESRPDGVALCGRGGDASWRWLCRADGVAVEVKLPDTMRLLLPAVSMQELRYPAGLVWWEEHITPAFARGMRWQPSLKRTPFRRGDDFTLLADSRLTPLALNEPRLWFADGDGRSCVAEFETGNAPAFRLFRRFGEVPGVHLQLIGNGRLLLKPGAELPAEKLAATPWRAGELSVTDLGNDYLLENRHYQVKISHCGGVVREFRRKSDGKPLFTNGELFLAGKKTLRTLVDFESFVSFKRDGNHLALSVEAELRPTYGRAENMPLVCNIQFLFDETPQITARYEVLPTGDGYPDSAFEFRFRADKDKRLTLHPAGTILPGNRYGMNVRFDASGAGTPVADAKAEVTACRGPRPDLIAGCFTWNSLRSGKIGAKNDDFPEGVTLTHNFRSYPVFRNNESAMEMRFPDPPLELSVGPATLPAGSDWLLTVSYSGENLVMEKPAFRRSAWTPDWNDAPNQPVPVIITLSGTGDDGKYMSETRKCLWQGSQRKAVERIRFRIPRDLRSPVVRVQSKVAEESTLWIHSVTLTPAEPDR